MELLQDFYETTLEALKDAKNDRLWFKTNTKLGKLYFDRSDYNKLAKILKQLHQSCQVSHTQSTDSLCMPLWSSGQSFWLQIHRSWVSEKQRVWNGVHSAS
jgi:hypothetical protein